MSIKPKGTLGRAEERPVPCIFCDIPVSAKIGIMAVNEDKPGGQIGRAHPDCKDKYHK